MKENNIKIVKIEVGMPPVEKEIPNTLEVLQAEVGGLIQCVYLDDGYLAIVNEEGKINGMEMNRRLGNDIICGPFFICADNNDGEFSSLTEEQMKKAKLYFADIPEFAEHEIGAEPKMTLHFY